MPTYLTQSRFPFLSPVDLSLGREDLLEKEMATNSSILAWKIPWIEKPGGRVAVHGVAESDVTKHKHAHTPLTQTSKHNLSW